MEIEFKLEAFSGPLDLLLHLIEKNKVSITDIPIVLITSQYLDYVSRMDHEDLELVSEFTVMAATLLDIKSRELLPRDEEPEDEEDPREELIARLLEYKTYKMLGKNLTGLEEEPDKWLYKEPTIPKEVLQYKPPVEWDELLSDVTLNRLSKIFMMVMRRQVDRMDPIRSSFSTITREKIRVADKLTSVFSLAKEKKKFSFKKLLSKQASRTEIVVTFLAVLELMKEGVLLTTQEENFGDMTMTYQEGTSITMTQEELAQYDD